MQGGEGGRAVGFVGFRTGSGPVCVEGMRGRLVRRRGLIRGDVEKPLQRRQLDGDATRPPRINGVVANRALLQAGRSASAGKAVSRR